jgi:hypothetical protein
MSRLPTGNLATWTEDVDSTDVRRATSIAPSAFSLHTIEVLNGGARKSDGATIDENLRMTWDASVAVVHSTLECHCARQGARVDMVRPRSVERPERCGKRSTRGPRTMPSGVLVSRHRSGGHGRATGWKPRDPFDVRCVTRNTWLRCRQEIGYVEPDPAKPGRRWSRPNIEDRRQQGVSCTEWPFRSPAGAVEAWLFEGRAANAPPTIRQKHEWVRDYHNTIIREVFPHGPDDALEFADLPQATRASLVDNS